MVKIVIDATPIRPKPSGIGVYVLNLIQGLYKLQDSENFQLGISYQPSLKNWISGDSSLPPQLEKYRPQHFIPLPVTLATLLANSSNPILSHCEKYFDSPDLINGTDHFVYPCKKSLKVMTIHDLTFLKYPEYASPIVKKTYKNRVQKCLQWTDSIITFTNSTRKDICKYFNFDSERIFVTPQASRYENFVLESQQIEILKKTVNYDFSQPYLLFVSTLEPRKNIINLIRAFNSLKKDRPIKHHLILIGQKGWDEKLIFTEIERSPYRDCIHHLDYLSDELVALFYSQAEVFVYPSFYEGFGLPVLEAMTLGAPVITSNTSSLPEVAGDAALLINPHNPIELADAIFRVIQDSHLRQMLIQKGKERAKSFSWEKTAKATLNAYRETLIRQ
ncbi:glycosyltransferase family 4 protein [Lusitaniella coriacea LEGE 07157]|uniref:Glycosyltransferase family 4 protein n=1 Tax=Lusitaniella coriacea LEGE 07157 TaxID=945747 RepID=A0A8J7JAK2_9CYAN|nr:glycosyltransferase family 1 protein [Lusitaniella coriacea]MBE9116455.1 glycosyltransferase family 4 protein [Lusitaniella coriacea LEGE 07157]